MSTVYNLEPQPTAKVLLETTAGEIELELFAKQTPLASRNFIQLCLEGYYNGTIFHRLVPGFIVQGGDPSGTGDGGEAVYDGGVFEDEFHSRLKFNRRGLLGMANSGRKNDNGSQFFLTLGKTEELANKNTMFGRVVGDTIYNLVKIGDAELADGEGSERPMYPTKITKTEVLLNPFEDIVPRAAKKVEYSEPAGKVHSKKSKKKTGKALLSFGGDDGGADSDAPVIKKAKFNPKLVAAGPGLVENSAREGTVPRKSTKPARRDSPTPPRALQEPPHPELQLPIRNEEVPSRSASSTPEPEPVTKVSSLLDRTNAQIAELKDSMKRNVSSTARSEPKAKSALEQMIPATAVRGRKRKHGNAAQNSSDAKTLDMLNAFRSKLEQAPSQGADSDRASKSNGKTVSASNEGAGGDDEAQLCDLHFIANCQSCASWDDGAAKDVDVDSDEDGSWMNHALVFDRDRLGKDLSWKKKNEEDLVVIDPREKAKDIMAEQKAKKAARSSGNKIRDAGRDSGRNRHE